MRKETEAVAEAFINGTPLKKARTNTDGQNIWLHGNLIARKTPDGSVEATLAGWDTLTTRERLNGLCVLLRAEKGIYRYKGTTYWGTAADAGKPEAEIGSNDWFIVE